jgi:hypothetical protein
MTVKHIDLTQPVLMLNFLAVLVMRAELLRTRLH